MVVKGEGGVEIWSGLGYLRVDTHDGRSGLGLEDVCLLENARHLVLGVRGQGVEG